MAVSGQRQPDVNLINILLSANTTVTSKVIAAAADKPTSTFLNKFLEIVPEVTLTDPKMLYKGVQVAAEGGFMGNMNVFLKIIDDKELGDKASLIEELSQAMFMASQNGHARIVSLLLDKYFLDVNYARYGDTLLKIAADQNRKEVVELLLEKGADVNQVDYFNETTLANLCRRSSNDYLEVLKLLLANNASVNQQNNYGGFALLHAAGNGYTEVVEVLLSNGADVELQNIPGETSLMRASERKKSEVVDILIENGANITIPNRRNGRTAFLFAAISSYGNYDDQIRKTLDILFKAGADIHKQVEMII